MSPLKSYGCHSNSFFHYEVQNYLSNYNYVVRTHKLLIQNFYELKKLSQMTT